eukprot:11847588-Karenia_brevis.AAC.1
MVRMEWQSATSLGYGLRWLGLIEIEVLLLSVSLQNEVFHVDNKLLSNLVAQFDFATQSRYQQQVRTKPEVDMGQSE